MTAEVFDLPCCSSCFVRESTLSHSPKAHHSLVPKLSHHGGKNSENREQKPNSFGLCRGASCVRRNCKNTRLFKPKILTFPSLCFLK